VRRRFDHPIAKKFTNLCNIIRDILIVHQISIVDICSAWLDRGIGLYEMSDIRDQESAASKCDLLTILTPFNEG
jgi:hypothetical protein